MSGGLSHAFFAFAASALRLAAWIPLGVGEAIMTVAEWCEDRASSTALPGDQA